MPGVMLTVADYVPARGVVIVSEGGDVLCGTADPAGRTGIVLILLDCAIWGEAAPS